MLTARTVLLMAATASDLFLIGLTGGAFRVMSAPCRVGAIARLWQGVGE
jgi:hypothetical protein